MAARLATRVIVMGRGEVLRDGKPEQVTPQLMAQAMQMQRAAEAAQRDTGGRHAA
jgi:ABC-type glutathione transport system ATPase component